MKKPNKNDIAPGALVQLLIAERGKVLVEHKPRGANATRRECVIVGRDGYLAGKPSTRTLAALVSAGLLEIVWQRGTTDQTYQVTEKALIQAGKQS